MTLHIIEGLGSIRKGKRFPASKIDRRFSYSNIKAHLANNRPLHPQSKWMYADGSIVPLSAYKGIKFTRAQINDYVSGKTIRIDGCQGNPSTVYIKFDPTRMVPAVYSSNPDAPLQSKNIPSQEAGITLSTPSFRGSIQEEQGFAGGGGITWPEYRASHMDLPVHEALRRFRTIKRGQNPNTKTGGMHIRNL